jgi:hypothetical protein
MIEERRRYRRTPKRIRLEFRKKGLLFLEGAVDTAEATDVSSTGVRISTRMGLSKGERVKLLISSVPGEPELPFAGRVVWTRALQEKGESYTQAGIEFVRLGLKQRVLLVRLATGF